MALPFITLRPSATPQPGDAVTVPSGSVHTVWADNSDATYARLDGDIRLDTDVTRVTFPALTTLPAGSRVYSVRFRRRIKTVLSGQTPPMCRHWVRALVGDIEFGGQQQRPTRTFFSSPCPTSETVEWIDETVAELRAGPGGLEWDPATNLAALAYEAGRDDAAGSVDISGLWADVVFQEQATLTVTGPTTPNTATRATVTWSYGHANARPQEKSQVAVYTDAQVSAPGFVPFESPALEWSGWVASEDRQWTMSRDITDGVYHAYVQVTAQWAGVGEFLSDIESITWTRDATPDDPPPAAVLSSAVFDPFGPGSVDLTAVPSSASPVTEAFTFEVTRDEGDTWIQIPSLTKIPADGMNPVTVSDRYALTNVWSRYRVIALGGSPLVAAGEPSNELAVRPYGEQHVLICPENHLLDTVMPVEDPGEEGIKATYRITQGMGIPVGRPGQVVLPIQVRGGTHGEEHELPLLYQWDDDSMELWPAFKQLVLSSTKVMWKQPDGSFLWGVLGPGLSGKDTTVSYNAAPGLPDVVGVRKPKVTFTEQAAPDYY